MPSDSSGSQRLIDAAVLLLAVLGVLAPEWLAGGSIYFCKIDEFYSGTVNHPWDDFMRAQWREGRFPLWNPYSGLGAPLWANLLAAPLAPLKLVVLIPHGLWKYEAYVVLRLWVAALGMSALLQQAGRSRSAARTGAILFGLCGHFLRYRNETYLNVEVWLPWIVWAGWRLADSPTWNRTLVWSLLLTAMAWGGNPEAIFWGFLWGVLSWMALAWRSGQGWRCLPHAIGRIGLLAAGSALVMLPFFEYYAQATHFMHPPGMGFLHFPLRDAVKLLLPWLEGDVHRSSFRQTLPDYRTLTDSLSPFTPTTGALRRWTPNYLGMGGGVLALAGLMRWRAWQGWGAPARRLTSLWLGLSLFALAWAFGLLPFNLLLWIPPLDRLNHTKHTLVIVWLTAAWLAAGWVDAWARQPEEESRPLRWGLLLLSPLGLVAMYTHRAVLHPTVWAAPAVMASMGFLISHRGRHRMRWASALIPWIVYAELWTLNRGHVPQPQPEIAEFEGIDWPASYRLAGGGAIWVEDSVYPPNLSMRAGVRDLRLLDGLYPKRWAEYLARLDYLDESAQFNRAIAHGGLLAPDFRPHAFHRLGEAGIDLALAADEWPSAISFVDDLLASGRRTVSDPESRLGRIYVTIDGRRQAALFMHAPAMLEIDLAPSAANHRLRLHPIFQTGAEGRSDGVHFLADLTTEGHALLSLNRFLRPEALNPVPIDAPCDESGEGWRCAVLKAGIPHRLRLETRPGDFADFDWSGWQIRLENEGDEGLPPGIERSSLGGYALYRNRRAESRIGSGWTLGREWTDRLVFSRLEGSAALVIRDLAFPGWRAYDELEREWKIVGGEAAPIRTVETEASVERIEMRYQPWAFRIGLWSGAAGVLAWSAAWRLRRYGLSSACRASSSHSSNLR